MRLSQASFPRFLLVGGSFALIYSLLAAFLTAVLPFVAPLSAAIAWLACIPPAWFCQRRFTFQGAQARKGGGILYLLPQCLGMMIAAGAGWLFATGAFLADTLVYLLASALAAVVSYAITRLVIFTNPT
ncbi:GtrA family protein [Xinfangfangia sp. D13-10-4-6]|uniref:GtrA family protein n=1 Tax=Pseudogemmobacter hezensis TaxID=2737662 RepID=UPI001C12F298|nr:GtrA family protein [Pseudogemmobacter hezensis]NPD16310.1 GtrA family protein [Pseudogemmobacter hezensis]